LEEQGFEVEDVYDIEQALRKAKSEPWDLIILDIRAPQGDRCFDSFEDVREINTAPVVILSGLGQDEYIVKSLNAGADDYLVKPISARVFLARVFAALRRAGRLREETPSGVFKQGDLVIDFERYEVSVEGQPVQLTVSEFRLLSYLARNAGHVVSSRDLVREVQGYDCSLEEARDIIKVHIHNRSLEEARDIIKVHIHNLRRKLGLNSKKPPYIRNVRGFGYMFERRTGRHEESVNRVLT